MNGTNAYLLAYMAFLVRRIYRYEATYLIIAKLIFLFGEPLLRSNPLKFDYKNYDYKNSIITQ